MIRSHQTYMSLTDVFFKQALLSIFKQCCEKGTRERKLGLPHYWWTDAAGRSTIETIHEVRLKQFCARFGIWVEQASQSAAMTSRRNQTRQEALFFTYGTNTRNHNCLASEIIRKETPCIFGPAPARSFLVRASSGRPSCCASTTPQHFSCEDEEPRPNSAQGGKDTRL